MTGLVQGLSTVLNTNEVYGLPAGMNFVQSSGAIDSSVDGTTWAALTGANTVGVQCAGKFIRATVGTPAVLCKRMY